MNNNESTSNDIIEQRLNDRLKDLGEHLEADLLTFVGDLIHGADDQIRYAIEGIGKKRKKLVVILETPGGYIEIAERIANTFRHHYKLVEFLIPNYAFSAGTILVMSGDAIYMDYYSVLGPIDPQVSRSGAKLIPALGYLIQYDRLIEKSRRGELTTAELHYLIERFDPGELYTHERARELSISLLKEWLVKYKFKNWKITENRKLKVTKAMKMERAEKIAEELNKTDRWHIHSRGISMATFQNDSKLKLKIDNFADDSELNEKITYYYKLLGDYMMRRGHRGVIHTAKVYVPLSGRS